MKLILAYTLLLKEWWIILLWKIGDDVYLHQGKFMWPFVWITLQHMKERRSLTFVRKLRTFITSAIAGRRHSTCNSYWMWWRVSLLHQLPGNQHEAVSGRLCPLLHNSCARFCWLLLAWTMSNFNLTVPTSLWMHSASLFHILLANQHHTDTCCPRMMSEEASRLQLGEGLVQELMVHSKSGMKAARRAGSVFDSAQPLQRRKPTQKSVGAMKTSGENASYLNFNHKWSAPSFQTRCQHVVWRQTFCQMLQMLN